MELPKDIKDEIWDYCRVNEISSVDDFITKMVRQGFTSEKFGSTPWDKPTEVKEVEVIKEVEKIVEKKIEVIKEVEVIKEIEKEVFVTDDEANKVLKKQLIETTKTIQDMTLDFSAERKVSTNIIQELNLNIDTLKQDISDFKDKLKQLEEELEIEKNKPKQEDGDIYGGKEGFLGSNTSDLWKKKK